MSDPPSRRAKQPRDYVYKRPYKRKVDKEEGGEQQQQVKDKKVHKTAATTETSQISKYRSMLRPRESARKRKPVDYGGMDIAVSTRDEA